MIIRKTKGLVFYLILGLALILTTLFTAFIIYRSKHTIVRINNSYNQNGKIGIAFTSGLSIEDKYQILVKSGLDVPKDTLYPTVEFEIKSKAQNQDTLTLTLNKLKHEPGVVKVEQTVGNFGVKLIKITINRDTNKDEVEKIMQKYGGELYFYNNKNRISVETPRGKEKYYVDKLLQDKRVADALEAIKWDLD